MTYYRVKDRFDQRKRAAGSILVAGELYTGEEIREYEIPLFTVDPVNVDEVYWFFCARFSDD